MTIQNIPEKPQFSSLPPAYAINLDEFGAISLSGEDQTKYLQGQVTCDVSDTNSHTLLNGAHCNAKGKVFSVFRFINKDGKHLLLQSKSCLEASLKELQKFGVFSQVTIEQDQNLRFLAFAGEQIKEALSTQFSRMPDSLNPVVEIDSTTLVYIAGAERRYLAIDTADNIKTLISALSLPIYSNAIWTLHEILSGFPVMTSETESEFVPQMLNVQAIDGISFTKGCYLGQETVARMQYLGKNKRSLYALNGNASVEVKVGSIIEKQLGDNWRRAGEVLTTYLADNSEIALQAVLSSDITSSDKLRLKGDETSQFSLLPLPYTLNEE